MRIEVGGTKLRPHPLNHGFDWQPVHGPFRRLAPEQADQYNDQGYFILREALAPDEIAELVREIDPLEALVTQQLQTRPEGRYFIARADEITFSVHLAARSARLRRFVSGPLFQDLAHDILGADVRLYWDQAVYKKPGTHDPFPWHQDNGYAYVEPQQYLSCWIALSDADENSGCPWIVPKLHQRGTFEHRLTDLGYVCFGEVPELAIAAPVRAGDIVVFSSLTPHATGPNHARHVRKAYIVQLAPEGAEVLRSDADGRVTREPANAANRQFSILVGGHAASENVR